MKQQIVLIVLIVFFAQMLLGQQTNVAVVNFYNSTSIRNVLALTEQFRSELFLTSKFMVIERDKMNEILEKQRFQQRDCSTRECLVEMGKLLNVHQIFAGTISEFRNVYSVMIRIVDVKSGKIIDSLSQDFEPEEKLMTEGMRFFAQYFSGVQISNKTDDVFNIEMVFVKGGTFKMGDNGSNNKEPVPQVSISDFYLGKYEVTQKQWRQIMGNNPSNFKGENLPVESVSWEDVEKFINKLNSKTGGKYRLPTEAEWEYAAKSGNSSQGYKYSGSNDANTVAWYKGNSDNRTHEVGTKQPNELGIYDMSGNVWEWCWDWFDNSPQPKPPLPSRGYFRVMRGGSWLTLELPVAERGHEYPHFWHSSYGFRLARDL